MISLTTRLMYLIVLIVGLPLFSETVYTPSLPSIAHYMHVSEAMVEYTLTIYLFAFSLGTLFWGIISDRTGRKPCVLAGFLVFILGCLGCYFSTTIESLLLFRFIQAFGGSVGSVLGQAISRDHFHGAQLAVAYAVLGGALGIFPAVGPTIGGYLADHWGWSSNFLFLMMFAAVLWIILAWQLPETHVKADETKFALWQVFKNLMVDPKVIGLGILVGLCNGISFSYYAEAPFYLIEMLGLSATQYGLTFIPIALSTILGGYAFKKLQSHRSSYQILTYGIWAQFGIMGLFSLIMLLCHLQWFCFSKTILIAITLSLQTFMMFFRTFITSNSLALALTDYKWCTGTASSIFGCFYYGLISICTLGMGWLHNGTLLMMPLFFLGITISMLVTNYLVLRRVFVK